jgi:rare lipoprotein A (peptidoglycan hydrolase)
MRRALAYNTLLGIAVMVTATILPASAALAGTGGASAATVAPTAQRSTHAVKGTRAANRAVAHGAQIATWFGPGFYGQKTACGQTLTPQIVGVASRTLPCGTLVLVSYKGRHLTVPVIDRGPYGHNGASWDLTWGAASALTITETVRVKTKVVGSVPNGPLLGVPAAALQAAATTVASGGTPAS